jgi:hypothetical protein
MLQSSRNWTIALWLAVGTIVYNLAEGMVSVSFGFEDETLALFGFGADSFIEVISAVGIGHMLLRLRTQGSARRDAFERTALRITGFAFMALAAVLGVTAVLSVVTGHEPHSTVAGVVISVISLGFMWALIRAKVRVGTVLNSAPILADANCSKVCLHMSIILLVSSTAYYLWNIPYVDAAGAVGLAWYSIREGRECFEKAAKPEEVCADDCC